MQREQRDSIFKKTKTIVLKGLSKNNANLREQV